MPTGDIVKALFDNAPFLCNVDKTSAPRSKAPSMVSKALRWRLRGRLPRSSWGEVLCRGTLNRGERLVEIADDIVDMLDSDRQAHIGVGNTGLCLLLGRELRMRRRCWMNGKRADVANIGDVIEHHQLVDKFPPGIAAAL